MAKKTSGNEKNRYLDANEEPNRWLSPVEGYEEKPLVSLKESVQRINSLVNDQQTKELVGEKHIQSLIQALDKNIWIAEKNSSEPKEGLSKDESAAIHLYTIQWSHSDDNLSTVINKILRSEKRNILKPWFSYLKLILTALFKLPSKKGIIWRGIRGNVTDQYQEEKVWWGFSSCTETMGEIDQFLGRTGERTIFMIDCMYGKAIRNHSKFPEENEVLLMPGTYFHVIDKHSPAEHLYIIHLQETAPPYELLKPPFQPQLPSTVPPATLDNGISPKDSADSPIALDDLFDDAGEQEKAREIYMNKIHQHYINHGKYKLARVEHRNIILVGRTGTGMSTVKALLVDPTTVPDELSLKSGTRGHVFESFHISDDRMVLNIIDTPGLFERDASDVDIRNNEFILRMIGACVNREVTKLHVICFCMSVTCGINEGDIQSMKLLIDFFGTDVSRNSCLIITRCEWEDDEHRARIIDALKEDAYFKEIMSYFQLGVYFSGALNRDDYNNGNMLLLRQFVRIHHYREELIQLFTRDIRPCRISETMISEFQQSRWELEKMKTRAPHELLNSSFESQPPSTVSPANI